MSRMIPRWFQSLVFLAILLTSISQATEPWVLRENGIGPVKIGLTSSQLRMVLGEKLSETDSGSESCYYLLSHKHPHISFMMIDDRLARIDVDSATVLTSTGIRVGDTEERVQKVYGSALKTEPHKYIDDGHYLTVSSKNGGFGIRFETEKGKITMFYAGKFDAIQYVEGCL